MGCISSYTKTDRSCSQTADEGYNSCAQTRDDGYNSCDDWGWFSWLCDAWTWISNIVCVAWTWISNVVCVAWNVVTTVICVAWDFITTVVNAVLVTLGSLLSPILNFLAGIVLALEQIPYVGRVVGWILGVVSTIVNFVVGVIDFVGGLLGIRPEKRLYLLVINQNDENGQPVATRADMLAGVSAAIQVYREQANIRVLPLKLFNYRTPASDDEQASDDYIATVSSKSDASTLDVDCGASDFAADLGTVGASFQDMMLLTGFWTNFRRLIGYGAPVCAFAVRSFSGTSDGCSLGPLADYVMVNFARAAADAPRDTPSQFFEDSILPHEMGHACSLWHVDPPNLMAPSDPRAVHLSPFQIALMRASRHVTYF